MGREQVQESGLEQRGIEKRGVFRPGARAVARMTRELFDGDILGNFEGELKRSRRRSKELAPKVRRRKLIEGKIAADYGKRFGVLGQTFLIEALFGKPAARGVAAARVDLAEPALVFPGTGPDVNLFGG